MLERYSPKRYNDFNSHAHVERDVTSGLDPPPEPDFNSHAHVERDSQERDIILIFTRFQLTRSRGA